MATTAETLALIDAEKLDLMTQVDEVSALAAQLAESVSDEDETDMQEEQLMRLARNVGQIGMTVAGALDLIRDIVSPPPADGGGDGGGGGGGA